MTFENSFSSLTASIISKKAAENIRALVLDVKVGRAAFFKNLTDARLVAKSLVSECFWFDLKTFHESLIN